MTYKIVKATSVDDLETQVVELMKKGWTPMNGGFLEETQSSTPERFMQVCVQYPAATPMEVVIVNKADAPVLIQTAAAPTPPAEEGEDGAEEDTQSGTLPTPVKKKSAKKKTKVRKK